MPPAWAKPAVMGATPGCRRPSCVRSRPFRGRSTACFSETTLPRVWLVSTVTACPETLTSVCSLAIRNCTGQDTTWPMSMRMDEAEYGANPWAFTSSRYVPTGRSEKWNAPWRDESDCAREAGLRVVDADFGVRHQRRGRIGDLPFQGSDGGLCADNRAKTHE